MKTLIYTVTAMWGAAATILCSIRAREKSKSRDYSVAAWLTTAALAFATSAVFWNNPAMLGSMSDLPGGWHLGTFLCAESQILMCLMVKLTLVWWMASEGEARVPMTVLSAISVVATAALLVLFVADRYASAYINPWLTNLFEDVASGAPMNPSALTFALITFGYVGVTCIVAGVCYGLLAVGTWQTRRRAFVGIAFAMVATILGLIYAGGYLFIIINAYSHTAVAITADEFDLFGVAGAGLLAAGLILPYMPLTSKWAVRQP
ncbi:hypothetical protein ACFWAP_00450 [Streptomyces goshikiensis]|uniref:hypothetical protein n=1 Tax=Streptomyces goshikiensis TaxID=1942 RepID=UPI0036655DDF